MLPVIAWNLLSSIHLLTGAARCAGIEGDRRLHRE